MNDTLNYMGLVWVSLVILKVLGYLNWGWIVTLFFPIWFSIAIFLAYFAVIVAIILAVLLLLLIFSLCGGFRD